MAARPPAATPEPGLAACLLAWYRTHRRDLPWRRTADPYAIWVSEVMLQQTQVATVLPYYERFLARFPTLVSLAVAPEEEVLRLWAGLGYYARARNLQRAARVVIERYSGRVPDDPETLARLPGVGHYTAGAIASLAYNRRAAVVDGNVTRVIARLFALRGNPRRAPLAAEIWRLAEALIPEGETMDFNSALMELGATVCFPTTPRCEGCPVTAFCRARAEGIQEALPESSPRPATEAVRMAAAVAWRGSAVLLGRVPEGRRWAGMWQFPNAEVRPDEDARACATRALAEWTGLPARSGRLAADLRHSVTRYRVHLQAFHCQAEVGDAVPRGCVEIAWVAPDECHRFPLPAPHRRIVARLHPSPEAQVELPIAD